jgi:hypothetical protein
MSDQTTTNGTGSEHHAPLPEQLRRQIAEAETLRTELGSQQPQAPSSEPAATPQPAPPPSGQPPAEDEQSWEQRYKSLHGRFENERRSNQAMADRLQQLENTISTLEVRGTQAPEPAPAPPTKLITEQEVNDYGQELLDVVGRRAREEISPEFEQLAARLNRLESGQQAVGQVIDRTQKQTVYQALAERIPEWRDINRDENFKAWLAQPDPFSGRRRHDMLTEAFDRHESGRVVTFFEGFLTEATGTPPSPPSPGTAAPPLAVNGNGSGRPSLEDFAAPGRARSAPQSLPPDKPIYTAAWIAKFSADKRRGLYRGREADAEAIERDIYLAQHEGRIQP